MNTEREALLVVREVVTRRLVAVMDATKVDRIIETTPNDARYFVGLMLWKPQQLEEEIRGGAWQLRRATLDTVLRSRPAELWKSLEGTDV